VIKKLNKITRIFFNLEKYMTSQMCINIATLFFMIVQKQTIFVYVLVTVIFRIISFISQPTVFRLYMNNVFARHKLLRKKNLAAVA